MASQPSECLEKTFQYCLIEWKVWNFSLATCPDDFVVHSPSFTVIYPQPTDWRFELKSHWTMEGENFISISLERLKSESGPETVWADLEVKLLKTIGNVEFLTVGNNNYFKRDFKMEVDLTPAHIIFRNLDQTAADVLEIRCRLIVDHNHGIKKLNVCTGDVALNSLCEDMRRMCNREMFSDAIIEVGTSYFRGHKSLLTARNSVLRDFLNAPTRKPVDLSMLDPEAVERVLRYFYTGNLCYVLVNPTIALHNALQFFEMAEIEMHFYKATYKLESKIKSREYEFKWRIPDFIKNFECCYYNAHFNHSQAEENWIIHLYTRGEDFCSDYMSVFLEYLSGPRPVDLAVDFIAYDYVSHTPHIKRICGGSVTVSERIGFTRFIDRCGLVRYLHNDALLLKVSLNISLGDQYSSTSRINARPCPALVPVSLFPNGLQWNMWSLFRTGTFSDIVLDVRGIRFSAHKCILAVRSKLFSQHLKTFHKTVLELDTDYRAFSELIKFIYTGHLDCIEMKDLKQQYENALVFGIPSLKQECSKYLKELHLTTGTATDVLVFADENRDQELKSAAMEFIWKSRNENLEEANWKHLANKRTILFKEIASYFKSQELRVSGMSNV